MKNFTYKSRYGTYENCCFQSGMYENGNTAIEIWSPMEGPITKVTFNTSIRLPHDQIAVKDYSENYGMVDWLQSMGFIEDTPVRIIRIGFAEIPVYQMTDLLKSHLLGEVEE